MIVKEYTAKELWEISEEREEWAKAAHDKDLRGSAKEWELTAAIARQAARALEAKLPDQQSRSDP